MKEHKILSVVTGSIAEELELIPGDILLSMNGQEVKDILDYRWLMAEEYLTIEVLKANCEIWELEIEKDAEEDLGLVFSPGNLGEDKHCNNACVFCFVDQQPPGLRATLYVKDDDPYQSFVMGNYVTLTNLNEVDISQIIKYRLSPIRVSVHAADMGLRQKMMKNPRACELFNTLERLSKAGIDMHFQVVLCKGLNDGANLDYTIKRLTEIGERALSLAIVPVGLTRYRDGLYPLQAFTKLDAELVIRQVEEWQGRVFDKTGSRFVFLADEWYVLAGKPVPDYCVYEDFPQLDNGVGMMALFEEEFTSAVSDAKLHMTPNTSVKPEPARAGIVTGQAAGDFMAKLSKLFTDSFPDIAIDIHVIENDFYGPNITVSGLITGQDILRQLDGKCKGLDTLFIPQNAFCAGTEVMICGTTLSDISKALGTKAGIGAADGGEFCWQLLGCLGLDDFEKSSQAQ